MPFARFNDLPAVKRFWLRGVFASVGEEPPADVDMARVRQIILWKSFDSDRQGFIRVYRYNLSKLFRIVGERVSDKYAASGSVTVAVQASRMNSELTTWFKRMHYDVEKKFGQRTLRETVRRMQKADDDFDPNDLPEMQNWNKRVVASQITNISKAAEKRIRKVITNGIDNGDSIDSIAKQLRTGWGFSDARADSIARTEVVAASNAANRFVADEFLDTDRMRRVWLATADDRVRDTHERANGQTRKWDTPFDVGGYKLMFPGDSTLGAGPEETVNCRCVETYETR